MKKFVLILTLVICIQGFEAGAQEWAPEGADWYYDYENFWYTGYVHITVPGDTIIHDTACRILNRFSVIHNLEFGTTSYHDHGDSYMYGDNNGVYLFENDRFYLLYDFSAVPGDTLIIPQNGSLNAMVGFGCDPEGMIVVTDTGTININDQTLRRITVAPVVGSHWAIYGEIVETIGSINSYMLPEPDWCVADLNEGGPLRCYSDPDFGLFNTGISPECDYLVSVPEVNEKVFEIFPNPCRDILHIDFAEKGNHVYKIYSSSGTEIIYGKFDQKENKIDLSRFNPGIYLLVISNGDGVFTKKIIKK